MITFAGVKFSHMATIKRELSPKVNGDGKSEIILRVSVCRGVQPRIKSGIFIDPTKFHAGAIIKPRAHRIEFAELRQIESELIRAEQFLIDFCLSTPADQLSRETIAAALEAYRHPRDPQPKEETEERGGGFFGAFGRFLETRNITESRKKSYRVLCRALQRFEAYQRREMLREYALTLDGFTVDTVQDFECFLRNEPAIYEKYPDIYLVYPSDTRKARKYPKALPKGDNTIVCTFSRLRAFFNWCNAQGLTMNRPFLKYAGVKVERYGTPYYITAQERDHIAEFDLSNAPALEVQRDIFIFHCFIGCRVSDLMRLTPANLINNGIEYIATKTKGEHPEVIRVPLHERAQAILKKYQSNGRPVLLPFISAQKYNEAIKRIFTICGITRAVTVLNPTTGEEEQRPINEIASSHIARRTFIGNLYKQVKDPNIIGKLSGHKEGSKAFARYRDIDEDVKRDLINLL